MTAHRRGFLLRVGTAIALVTGVMLLPAVPAHAAAELEVQDINSVGLTVGAGSQALTIRVRNAGDEASTGADVTVTVPLSEHQIKIGSSNACKPNGNIVVCQVPTLGARQVQAFTIPLTPPGTSNLKPGQEANGKGKAVLSTGDEAEFTLTLRGANQAASVTEVSGTVVNSATADGVAGVLVVLKDSAGHEYTATTSNSGGYRFTGNADKPISPGQLSLTASKEGFDNATITRDGQSGRGVTGARISLKAAASTAPSAPAASESPVGPSESVAAPPNQTNTSSNSGPGMLAWLIIGLGVLLLLLGGGAIAYMLIKRKSDQAEADEDEYAGAPTRVGAGAVAGAPGGYRGAPASTMVAHDGPAGMNDATAIVRPEPLDEFPDPYAAPMPAGGYGPDRGYDTDPGYDGGQGYGANRGHGGYGSERGYSGGGGGYPDEPRRYSDDPRGGRHGADEPTGRFASGGGGYPAAGSYPGTDHDEYRRPGRPPEPQQTRYGSGGYDQPGAGDYRTESRSRYDAAPSRGATPPGRGRSVDWLDD